MRTGLKGLNFAAVIFGTAVLLGAGTTAHAITYGPDCGSGNCFGSVYTLTSQSLGGNDYSFTLDIDTSGFNNNPPASGLDGVAIKVVASSTDIVVNSFTTSLNANSFSYVGELGLNANGCGGGATSGFICASSSLLGGVAVPDGTYSFTWNTTISAGKLFTNENDWSLKALYVNANGDGRGLTSVSGGAVPVPGTSLMFGLGLALFLGWHHRSRLRIERVGITA